MTGRPDRLQEKRNAPVLFSLKNCRYYTTLQNEA